MRAFGMLILMAVSMPYALAECRITNSELEQMNVRQARFSGPDERRVDLQVHIADSGRERAAGFQHVCPETAESTSILFLFANPHVPSFHMRNHRHQGNDAVESAGADSRRARSQGRPVRRTGYNGKRMVNITPALSRSDHR